MGKAIRLGVVGGNRGTGFGHSLAAMKGAMELAAVCDLDSDVLERWKRDFPTVSTFIDYAEMLDSGIVDAVLIASPMPLHVDHAIAALKRGIHAASEVAACMSIAEGRKLIKAVEKSKAVYFFAENYCYSRVHMMVEHMCQKGIFGEITYVQGAYYHDCAPLMFDAKGDLTWRGIMRRDMNCHSYPTHTLGPIDRWLGVKEGKDRFVSVCAMASKQAAASAFAARAFGPKFKYADPIRLQHGDCQKALIKTANGVLIDLLFDPVSPRVGNCAEHFITGSEACFHSQTAIPFPDGLRQGPAVAFRKKGVGDGLPHYHWEPLLDLAEHHEHPLWRKHLKDAERAGHGGGDFFILLDFAEAILGHCPPAIDVYDAVLWSAFIDLTAESIRKGGAPVPVPEFKRK